MADPCPETTNVPPARAEYARDRPDASCPRGLLRPEVYPHPVHAVRWVETHISWVLLTGTYAYKVKKPVEMGFLDFSTLERRRLACEAELRLNRRLAPELYLDVVPITGRPDAPWVNGPGAPFEYAVRMREFPQAAQLDRCLDAGGVRDTDLESLARRIAAFHDAAPPAGTGSPFGRPQQVREPVRETLDALLADTGGSRLRTVVRSIQEWSEARWKALEPHLAARKREGHVREVHGDLHLANLVRLGDKLVPFDCIEFSEPLRWIDTMSDLAFLLMDLQFRGRRDLAYQLLNTYLEETGDYAGLRVLRYYLVYRALVRAKVAMLRAGQSAAAQRWGLWRDLRGHVELAQFWTDAGPPQLILMHGFSGSGKTWVSGTAMTRLPAVRIRSDIERKRLLGVPALAGTGSAPGSGAYSADVSRRTYDRLFAAARAVLEGGENAIVDAAFLRHADRLRFRALADALGARFVILSCTAPAAELQRRVTGRRHTGHDASEADRRVLQYQRVHAEPLLPEERAVTRVVDTSARVGTAALDGVLESLSGLAGPTDQRAGARNIGR